MNILYTAFKGKYNASNYLIAGMQGDTLFLTNSFQELEQDVASIDEHYDACLLYTSKTKAIIWKPRLSRSRTS